MATNAAFTLEPSAPIDPTTASNLSSEVNSDNKDDPTPEHQLNPYYPDY